MKSVGASADVPGGITLPFDIGLEFLLVTIRPIPLHEGGNIIKSIDTVLYRNRAVVASRVMTQSIFEGFSLLFTKRADARMQLHTGENLFLVCQGGNLRTVFGIRKQDTGAITVRRMSKTDPIRESTRFWMLWEMKPDSKAKYEKDIFVAQTLRTR